MVKDNKIVYCSIQLLETNVSSYTMCRILNQLILDYLGQWHLVACYLCKMILAKTQYKTHNGKFLTIIKAFKIWRYYLKRYKQQIFFLTDHNNL